MALDLTGEIGAYLRVSDDGQDVSTQYETLAAFEKRHNRKIDPSHIYVDEGWSRDEYEERPDWLRMRKAVKEKRIQALVITAKDRAATADPVEKLVFYDTLRKAGCKLVLATNDQVLNTKDLGSNINALIDGETELRELKEKSIRALEKMSKHFAAGRWMGGSIPYGLDVVCIDDPGTEYWRVSFEGWTVRGGEEKEDGKKGKRYRDTQRIKIYPDGTRQPYNGKDNFPARDRGQFLTLRPSLNPARLKTILDVFVWYTTESISTYQIAARLNERGDVPPADRWMNYHIDKMLVNPSYLGKPVWNQTSRAKWCEHIAGQTVEHEEKNTAVRKHEKKDWVGTKDRQFGPIVDPKVFLSAEAKIKVRSKRPRPPKRGGAWMGGLLRCAHCGENLQAGKNETGLIYVCASYRAKCNKARLKGKEPCPFRSVKHSEAEQWVKNYLNECGELLPARKPQKGQVSATIAADWEASMHRLVAAEKAIQVRVAEWMRTATADQKAKYAKATIWVEMDERYQTILKDGQPIKHEEVSFDAKAIYKSIFAGEREQMQSRLDQIETEHSRWLDTWQNAPTPRTKTKAEARFKELEAEIEELEGRLKNAAEAHDEAGTALKRLLVDWESAEAAMVTDVDGRAKAEAVRRVIDHISVTFAKTGRARPAWYASKAAVVAADGAVSITHEIRNPASAGRPGTSTSAGTRGCGCGTIRLRSPPPLAIDGCS